MAIIQCQSGHYYDNNKHTQCPYCTGNQTIGVTVSLNPESGLKSNEIHYQGQQIAEPIYRGQPQNQGITDKVESYSSKTVGLFVNDDGVSAVVGWLVCVEGKKRGKSFSLHGERNFVGRAKSNDVCIDFDNKVSLISNAIISFDSEDLNFYVQPGESQKNNVKLNGKLLLVPTDLKKDDILKVGDTKLLFRPFCDESFNWEIE